MLYSERKYEELSRELFKNPGSAYRGAPFWAWNCKLEKDTLLEQIECFKRMGMGGFHIHSRTGLAVPYLSDEFMELVKACEEKARNEGMLCWLYDEDRWPSGSAGGLVTRELCFRGRHLLFTPEAKAGLEKSRESFDALVRAYSEREPAKPRGYWLASYAVKLRGDCLSDYIRLSSQDETPPAGYDAWHAYMELNAELNWYNGQTYVDTLNPEAIEKFAEITYDRYYEVLGKEFSRSVPAIFTDEPQFTFKQSLAFASQKTDLLLPYTDDLPHSYRETYGQDLLATVPELFWELPGGRASAARYQYHRHTGERFAAAFSDTLGEWCSWHNIALTGHLNKEPTLFTQTVSLGEAMRSYKAFQIPGIDMLCDYREFTTAKQCQSAARQFGREAMLSELYGVTNWDFDFKGYKLQGDWQAALGVTVRVPHLSLVSMEGEAKRDYPSSFNYQAPWYTEYPLIEDYFARVNTALVRGRPYVKIGVIHPIESYWLYFGPYAQTFHLREKLEDNFERFIKWMLFGLLDYDYISEALFEGQTPGRATAPLEVGEMRYDVVIVPGCATLRSTTLERLENFRRAGGRLIFMGDVPELVDARPSDRALKLSGQSEHIPFSRQELLSCLEKERVLDIRYIESEKCDDHNQKFSRNDGRRTPDLLHQLRSDGACMWLFICHTYPRPNDYEYPRRLLISVKGSWEVELYNALNGEISRAEAFRQDGRTCLYYDAYAHDSILLKLIPAQKALPASVLTPALDKAYEVELLDEPVGFSLSEPNVLLLDMAEFALDGGEWEKEEEILRIDSALRRGLGWAPRSAKGIVQPWVHGGVQRPSHRVSLKYKIRSEVDMGGLKLALEKPEDMGITYNGCPLHARPDGWYADRAISAIPLTPLKKGVNELVLEMPFDKLTNLEAIYVLGDFGVNVAGRYSEITAPPERLVFGNTVNQGLPFYSANITYHCRFEQKSGGNVLLEVSRFGGHVIGVALDGKKTGHIAFAPHRLELGRLERGIYRLDITVFGNRFNTFGQVHLTNSEFYYFGPDSWRTNGSNWSYPYQLKPSGILSHPVLLK